jgi:Glycosyl transferase family 2
MTCNEPLKASQSVHHLQHFYTGSAILRNVPQNLAPASTAAYSQALRPPSKIEAVGIVIPARNQSKTIAKCIFSIFAANSYAGWRNSLWIVVVADACTDHTANVARDSLGAFGEVVEVSARSLQTAHRIGSSTVLEHFQHMPRHALLIASADAGMELRPDWVELQLQEHSAVRLLTKPNKTA